MNLVEDDFGVLNNWAKSAVVIPYVDTVKDKNDGDISSTIGTTLPMAAVRNHQFKSHDNDNSIH